MSTTQPGTTQPGDPSIPKPGVPAPVTAAAGDLTAEVLRRDQNKGNLTEAEPHSSSTSETGTLDREKERKRDDDVLQLARTITKDSLRRMSTVGGNYQVPFAGVEPNSVLDPNGPNFSVKAWYKNLVGVTSRDPERYPKRTAGVSFRNLNVHGFGTPTDYQKNVGNVVLEVGSVARWITGTGKTKIQILQGFDGLLESGEMLVVLGRPGSGCSTLLKTFAGETHGFFVDEKSSINYQGIGAKQMHNQFRGEAIYMAETDIHFPQLTVGQTLTFAAKARAPRDNLFPGISRQQYAEHMRDVVMAMFGIKHTINTPVGNDFVRGVSGGERKRVSISEAALSGSPLQCWDNSTRGLDSANAIEFCKTLRSATSLAGATAAVAIYQAPQTAYDLFDKVTVLYEGRQIYFGGIHDAKNFFIEMGFECPPRQTTADFLTSLTSPEERIIRPGFESKAPRTPDEFAQAWKSSPEYTKLIQDIEVYDQRYPIGGESLQQFKASRRAHQARQQRVKSPYTLSVKQQVELCIERGFNRLRGDATVTISGLFGNTVMGFIIASLFYNLDADTASFYNRGALLFFAVLMNAFASALEILTLYAQRPIVEKHTRYALYHPFSEAIASMLCDMPYKIFNCIVFNLVIYFMTNLRREPGAFFVFLLFSFIATLTMSMLFRTIAATSRTLVQALCPGAILILAMVIYTGFVIPPTGMVPWFRWINYINPLAYAFESLMVNEFHNRDFPCTEFIPQGGQYDSVPSANRICTTVGAVAGSRLVNGDAYIGQSFEYYHRHMWRNLGVIIAFMIFLLSTYLGATEYISAQKSKGEVLLFRRGHQPPVKKTSDDVENARKDQQQLGKELNRQVTAAIQKQTATFQWQNICLDIKIKQETRRILDHVDGWVKPGTLTALMGPSGAGKTTLLDVLATRVAIGVVTGQALVDGRQRDTSFQRKTGYAQQQDLHLQTSTVRESLEFSALMRQPARYNKKEKLEYVEEVIKLLGMESYADAVVGVPGEGLNVEQRKRLTIGVELAARPELLLFLDEPTSGLDSQTSWSILDLLEKLTAHGQAILCTIHQPSAVLFQRFDRLLFLGPEGKTVYFGDIGEGSRTLTSYFERNGAEPCPSEENPAEWMMATIGCAPGSHSEIDWPVVWRNSPERAEIHRQLDEMKLNLRTTSIPDPSATKADYREFAAPFSVQFWEVFKRVNAQYWRTPSYIYSKLALTVLSGLFVGFTFYKAPLSRQGLQNQMFSIFMLLTIFGNLIQQIMPNFVTQRALYEARERPAKTFSWQVFILSNVCVELPWNTVMAVLMFAVWYWPIGFFRNAEQTGTVTERSGLMFLYVWFFFMFTSTAAHALIAGMETAENAANLGNLLFMLCLMFCGVLASPDVFPRFWIFMYRLSPFTYLIDGVLSTGLANSRVTCSDVEILRFDPLPGSSCAEYMDTFISAAGGYLINPNDTSNCGFCSVSDTNIYLSSINSSYGNRWRNWGLLWVYVIFNASAAVSFYWLRRVPKKGKHDLKEIPEESQALVREKSRQSTQKDNPTNSDGPVDVEKRSNPQRENETIA